MAETGIQLDRRTAVVTGGYGVLGGTLASGPAAAGARAAVVGRRRDAAEARQPEIPVVIAR